MGEVFSFIIKALFFVTLPLWLLSLFIKGLRSKKPAKEWVVELLIIGFIALILGAIAIPDVLKFQSHAKASESKTHLGSIFTAQYKYRAKTGTFAGGPDAFMYLDWKPQGPTMYSYFCGDDYIPNHIDPTISFSLRPRIGREHRPAIVTSSATGFTCAAVGNIDNDPALDYWTVNDQKQFKNEPSDM